MGNFKCPRCKGFTIIGLLCAKCRIELEDVSKMEAWKLKKRFGVEDGKD